MAAGSCIGVEVWQRGGLLGVQLEEKLTSLVCAIRQHSVCQAAAPQLNLFVLQATNPQTGCIGMSVTQCLMTWRLLR